MKHSKKGILSVFVLLLLLLGFAQYSRAAEKILDIPLVVQAQDQWCWAGCSNAVLIYYTKAINQCSIADFAWTKKTCCWTPPDCNQPNAVYGTVGSIKGILNHWCLSSTGVASALTYAQCQTEINADRPFIIRYGWDSGGGHVIVGRGYYTDPNSQGWLYLMNPWPGIGYGKWIYDYVKRNIGDHTWTHTLKGIQRNLAAGDWKVTNTVPIKDGWQWKYRLSLNEIQGGCGKIVQFYWDYYDENNVWINRTNDILINFQFFNDCTFPGDMNGNIARQLPRLTKFCGDFATGLGDHPSGYVRISFVIKCDSGTTITRRKKFYLPPGAGGQKPEKTTNAGYGMPATAVYKGADSLATQ